MTKPEKSAFHFSAISSPETSLKQQQESELEQAENLQPKKKQNSNTISHNR